MLKPIHTMQTMLVGSGICLHRGAVAAEFSPQLLTSLGQMLTCAGCVVVSQVAERIAARAAARQAQDFAAADAVRKELAAKGIMLMDSPQGTTWRPGLAEEAQ